MVWFKVDDTLALHGKVVAAGNAAMGLWVRAGAWSMQQGTDGFIPAAIVTLIGKPAEARRLVEVGLWERLPEGYGFHEWEQRQPLREEIEQKRADWRERQAKARKRRKGGDSE